MANRKRWMQDAFSHSHGQFRAKAERAGMSTGAYARKVLSKNSHATEHTKKQARLALVGIRSSKKR